MQNQTGSAEIDSILHSIGTKHVEHREYIGARTALYTHATYARPGTPILLLGPSRVGKSKVAAAVRNMLERNIDSSEPRSIFTDAVNPDQSYFSMKHMTLRLLTEVNHPLYGFGSYEKNKDVVEYMPRKSATEPILRLALESAMQSRGIRWMFVDEAHHIVKTHSEQRAMNHLDSIKSLGNTSGVIQIWIGGYDLLLNGFTSTHLNGRMRIIHFKRYGHGPRDTDEFAAALASLNSELPFAPGKSLLDIIGPVHAYTYGCFGAVLTWVEIALVQMVLSKSRYLTPKHFTEARYKIQLDGLGDEIQRGEMLLESLDIEGILQDPREFSEVVAAQRSRRRVKSVQRKPKRDPVGHR